MRRLLCSLLVLTSACALVSKQHASSVNPSVAASESLSSGASGTEATPNVEGASAPGVAAVSSDDADDDADNESEDGSDESAAVEEEGESHELPTGDANVLRYTTDISDDFLSQHWKNAPEQLGSISIGFVDEGRLINAEKFPKGDEWILVSPDRAWATSETIQYVVKAIKQVRAEYPAAPPLRVNQISAKEGGYLRPHKSHQNGRDVDLGFYYPTVDPIRVRAREKHIDVAKNWALIKALVMQTDVQFVLVDNRIQKVLFDYALAQGENRAWLDSIFHAGKDSIVKHARRHRDHFHVRFYNARAQELGRRVAPMLAQRPDQNIAFHRVRSGDTLGAIARRYGSSVTQLQKANRMRGSFLRLAQQLRVPLRGPCTRCPIPPPVVVPERRLPPVIATGEASTQASVEAVSAPVVVADSVQPAPVPEGAAAVLDAAAVAPSNSSLLSPMAFVEAAAKPVPESLVLVPVAETTNTTETVQTPAIEQAPSAALPVDSAVTLGL
jgi:murein endopeptidase